MSVGRLAVRIVIGGLFIGHGTQKLKGWFGGSGLEGTAKTMEALDMHPVRPNAIAAGLTETVGGALLVVGLATPVASAGLIGVMATAIRKVHFAKGPWNGKGGWEYNAVLIATLTALAGDGPGRLSLDAARGRLRSGAGWGLFALALGVASSTLAIELGKSRPARSPADADADHDATDADADATDAQASRTHAPAAGATPAGAQTAGATPHSAA